MIEQSDRENCWQRLYQGRSSWLNRPLQVVQRGNRRCLTSGRYILSLWSAERGDFFRSTYWDVVATKLVAAKPTAAHVLILGAGGGTLAWLFHRYLNPLRIVGVEIEPEIIRLGREFFYLDAIPELNVIQADARAWISTLPAEPRFDLIVMDICSGVKKPEPGLIGLTARHLAAGGILAMVSLFPAPHRIDRVTKYVSAEIHPFFHRVSFLADPRPAGWRTTVIFAWNQNTTSPPCSS